MTFEPIAIVGQSCILPGALTPQELWRAVADGRDLISSVPADRWGVDPRLVLTDDPGRADDHTWSDRGGYVEGFEAVFDPTGFGVVPGEIEILDPLFHWVLHGAREALRSADALVRKDGQDRAPTRTGAVLGNLSYPSAALSRYAEAVWLDRLGPGFLDGKARELCRIQRPHPLNRFMSGLPAHVLSRALTLDSQSTFCVDAACSSSLYAIKLACDMLHDRRTDMMVAGGVNRADDLFIHIGFCALQAMSRTGQSRPFNRGADGLVPAEGAAFVLLERLSDARNRGHEVLGVIRAVGLSNDGRGRGLLAPCPRGQERALRQAYDMCDLSPTDISLVECHATGTPVGDVVEIESMSRVFAQRDLPVGSLKSNLGHLITASGAAGLIKVLAAMREETLPPTLHADRPLKEMERTPLRAITRAEPWPAGRSPRRAAVNNFGFGGNNAHLLVEEPAREEGAGARITGWDAPDSAGDLAVVAVQVAAARDGDLREFSRTLFSGQAALRTREDGVRCGIADDIELPLTGMRFPPLDLDQTLAQQLLMLKVAMQALDEVAPLPRERTGVMIGMQCDAEVGRYGARLRMPGWARQWGEALGVDLTGPWLDEARRGVGALRKAAGVVGAMPNIPANRICSQFDLAGPSFTVSAEELSGMVCLDLAARALRAGELDAALVGAVDLCCEPVQEAAGQEALPDDRRTSGDAAVALVIKRLLDARRDGDTIHAVIPGGETPSESIELRLGLTGSPDRIALTPQFGHAHAAAGLLHVAAGALACRHRASPGGLETPPAPWWPALEPRAVEICVDALGGPRRAVTLVEPAALERRAPGGSSETCPLLLEPAPGLWVYSGADARGVLENLDQDHTADQGPARLAIVADDAEQLEARQAAARELLTTGTRPGPPSRWDGIYFNEEPMEGEVAFVFTGPAGVYPGMGRELMLALPELAERLFARCQVVEQTGRWIFDPACADLGKIGPHEKLWGSSFLSQLHTELTRGVLKISPQATVGFCSGETNALFAMDAWRDLDDFFPELLEAGVFSREISGEFAAVNRAWGGDGTATWVNWRVLHPREAVEQALADEPRCHLTIINAPGDLVIGGEPEACTRVVERVGRTRAYPLGYDVSIHCPEMESFIGPWRALHRRATSEVPGVRFYTSATRGHFLASADAAADALTGMATRQVDFPAVIEQAHADGVRIFIEHGPRDGCSKWIDQILGDRPHLAVPLDRGGRSSLTQAVNAAAQLAAAGVALDHRALTGRIAPERGGGADDATLRRMYPAHPEPLMMPPLPSAPPRDGATQLMPPAPWLPPILAEGGARAATGPSPAAPALAPPGLAARMHDQHARVADAHREFVTRQAGVHDQFLQHRQRSLARLSRMIQSDATPGLVPPTPAAAPAPDRRPEPFAAGPAPAAPAPPSEPAGGTPTGPSFDRAQLEVLAAGKISTVFGSLFEKQDRYERQVRLPEAPLLLVDRVTGIAGEPGSMGKGTIWTETDVRADAWYLNDDYTMPAGIVVESGQADLTLISWLGIDFHNRGERVYRLLGCELTNHGTLPRPGDTLCYDIHIDGHARVGGIRLFFFHYDCRVDGELRLVVRNAQAGFFTDEELADSGGVLWDASAGEHDSAARCDPPMVRCQRDAFSEQQVRAFSEGRVMECFGQGYELAETHTRTPKIQSGKMLLLQEVTCFDPAGGPWGKGYLRVENALSSDDWYLEGHFKNDPCMPGTLMCEGCLQAMAFYLTAMGYTLERDGWRFDPVPGETYKLQCRGQVTPGSRALTYEVFVEEIVDGPIPTIFADILGSSDGLKIFHGRRMGLRLIPDWPLTSMPHLLEEYEEPKPVARQGGFEFGYASLLACAWGKPSDAFGEMATPFDWTRHIARLPGPPYHFMSRLTHISGEMGSMKTGACIDLEYDIPPDAWYFENNAAPVMPFCVLLEAALQPCGWLAVFIGCPGSVETDVVFRNLDGTGVMKAELSPRSGTLRTRTTLVNISKMGNVILVSFELECFVGDQLVYELDTGFGFFPAEALAAQVGLPVSDEERALLLEPSDFHVDLTRRPERYCGGPLRLPAPMLLMLGRITGYWPDGGAARLGRLRADKDVDYSEWFFKAHFFQDPVQPGSLGLEAMIQLLQFYMIHEGMDAGIQAPRFEPLAVDRPYTWKYRGQVTPHKERITTEVEVLERGRDARGPFAVAKAALWVDGLQIYQSPNMALRIVAGGPAEAIGADRQDTPETEVLDPAVDAWLMDHRPNWTLPTLPLMSMLERIAGAAKTARGVREVVAARGVRVTGWLIFDGPRRLRATAAPPEEDPDGWVAGTLEVWREAGRKDLSRFEPVAAGEVLLDADYPPPPQPLRPLEDAAPVPDPYAAGALFHGPAFHLLKTLRVGASGSSATLDAGAGHVPPGLLNQGLLDAAVHGILHDELDRWCDEIPARHIAYPYQVEEITFHGPAPVSGEVRCEVRFDGFGQGPRFPAFRIQLILPGPPERVWASLRLIEVLIPMGPHADDRQKRIDFRDEKFLPGAGLSRFEGQATRLSAAEVKSRDWLRGSVAWAYDADDDGEDLVRQLTIKDHVSQRSKIHPALVTVRSGEAGVYGVSAAEPLTIYPVTVTSDEAEVTVVDAAPPRLDMERLRSFGRRAMGIGSWVGEDLSLGLCERFVGQVAVDDPRAFDQVREGSVLYLGNHQVQIESMIFPMVVTALTGVHVVTIAKAEHRTAWIGPLSGFSYSYPGVEYPRVIIYFDQQNPKTMFDVLEELREELTSAGRSIFVHVEGELGLGCREPVTRLSSVFIDLAQELKVPIVPVKLAGGLPVAPLDSPLDFPLGFARQVYHLGRPVMPDELGSLPYADRRRHLLEALNNTGPALAETAPGAPDPDFAAAVKKCMADRSLGQVQAVVLSILEGLREPSSQTRTLLDAVSSGELVVDDDDRGRWMASAARWLVGSGEIRVKVR